MVTKITNLGSDVVGEMTDVSLEFTVQNGIDKDGYILFRTPKWNAGTQSRGSVKPMIRFNSSEWNATEQAYQIPCSSALHPDI